MTKVIFIDIDGVLNSASGVEPFASDMEVKKLNLLHELIKETDSLGVVITSDRRCSKIDIKNKIDALQTYGINVLDCTRFPNDDDNDNRGQQIADYLSCTDFEIERILILDDNNDGISNIFEDEFILVDNTYGLDEEVYLKALDILNR